jgi:flagellar protein FliS
MSSPSGHQAYQVNAIETASPEQLTLMCYDGALKFMRRAVEACDKRDLARHSEWIGRAQAVVDELNITLNMEAGGEIAANLREIYLFVNRQLGSSVLQQEREPIEVAMRLIGGLRDSWAEAMGLATKVA